MIESLINQRRIVHLYKLWKETFLWLKGEIKWETEKKLPTE